MSFIRVYTHRFRHSRKVRIILHSFSVSFLYSKVNDSLGVSLDARGCVASAKGLSHRLISLWLRLASGPDFHRLFLLWSDKLRNCWRFLAGSYMNSGSC